MCGDNMIQPFNLKCYPVLPTVYDNSLSYYEVLSKVIKCLGELIDTDKEVEKDISELNSAVRELQEWITNYDTSYAEKVLAETIATMIFVEITDAGYIVYNIPENWESIIFNTTGLDIIVPCESEYGKLVLSY